MKLYNTLSRQLEDIRPLSDDLVTVYTCGPTVYDYPHIGNWFTFVRYDLLIRALVSANFKPKWIINITDVGHLVSDSDSGIDKLEKGAKREGKTAWQIAEHYSDYFLNSLKQLNILTPSVIPKATEHIDDIINFIKQLEDKGYTYIISDGIYFNTAKFKNYRQFARLDDDEQKTVARIDKNNEKINQADFALWKFSSNQKRDMEWPSPWGVGWPGWHIECSAMCLKYAGPTVDIHAGGIDHIPTHHTNEIAQSEAVTNKPLANIWMHANHVLIAGNKISKSLDNGITLEDIKQQKINLYALRLLVIESHYRTQSQFSWDYLKQAEQRLIRYRNFAARVYQQNCLGDDRPQLDISTPMQNDLNTPQALANIESFIDYANAHRIDKQSLISAIKQIDSLLGLNLNQVEDIRHELKELIDLRQRARLSKNWSRSDELRAELNRHNINILDSDYGPIWEYIN